MAGLVHLVWEEMGWPISCLDSVSCLPSWWAHGGARAAESEESYNETVNYAAQLAETGEKCLKTRVDPYVGGSSVSEGMYYAILLIM